MTSRRWMGGAAAGLLATTSLLWPATLAVADDRIGITEVAPTESFLVVTIPDWPRAREAMMRTPLGRLWSEPSFRDFVLAYFKEDLTDEDGEGGMWGWLAENIDVDDLREPSGAAGFALFAEKVDNPDKPGEQVDRIQAVLIAEFGDDAKGMMETLEEAIERLEREGHVELDETDHDGVDIRVIKVVEEEEDPEFAALREQWGMPRDRSMDAFNTMYMAHVGGRMVVSTSRDAIEQALDRIAGRRIAAVGDSRAYQEAVAQHPAGQHAMVIGLASEYIRSSLLGGEGGMDLLPIPVQGRALMEALGLAEIRAVGLGMRFDTDAGSMEQSMALLAPSKKGLLTLIDSTMTRFDPPAFVAADAMGVWSVALRFDRVGELVRNVIRAMPPEFQEQVLAGFDQFAAPILNSFGSELHVVRTLSRPLGAESSSTLVAIRLKDPLTLANTLNGFAGLIQMTPRVFEGNQLFEAENPGQPSIGIGFDHVFIGSAEAIENAMRVASRPDTPRLSGAPRFSRAAAPMSNPAALYYYDNTAESMAWTYWSTENAQRILAAQLEAFGLDPETIREYMDDFEKPDWHAKIPPLQMILDHVGDTVMEIRPTPDGFRGRAIILRPAR